METTRYIGIVLHNWLLSLVHGDVLFYALYFFLPAFFLVVICKYKPWKKIWRIIAFALPIIICVLPIVFSVSIIWDAFFSSDVHGLILGSVLLFTYVVGGVIGYFFNVRRVRHWLLLLVGLLVALSVYAFLDSYPPELSSFGSIVDEPISEKKEGFDYEIRIAFSENSDKPHSETALFDNRVAQLRVNGDSALVCTSRSSCGIKDSLETCEWITLKTDYGAASKKDVNNQFFIKVDTLYRSPLRGSRNLRLIYECCVDEVWKPFALEIPFDVSPEKRTVSQIHLLKKLVESYKEEIVPYIMSDGYRLEILLQDYHRGVRRRIAIGNVIAAEPGDLPNAKRIDEIARAFLPVTADTPMDWYGKKCETKN